MLMPRYTSRHRRHCFCDDADDCERSARSDHLRDSSPRPHFGDRHGILGIVRSKPAVNAATACDLDLARPDASAYCAGTPLRATRPGSAAYNLSSHHGLRTHSETKSI